MFCIFNVYPNTHNNRDHFHTFKSVVNRLRLIGQQKVDAESIENTAIKFFLWSSAHKELQRFTQLTLLYPAKETGK